MQVNGKVRARITADKGAERDELERIALANDRIAAQIEGKTLRKVVVVPGRLVNIVVS